LAVSQFQDSKERTCVVMVLPGNLERTKSEECKNTERTFMKIEMCCDLVAQRTVPEYYSDQLNSTAMLMIFK